MTIEIQPSSTFVPLTKISFPLKLSWGRPTISVDLGSAKAEFLLDTAASASLHLARNFVDDTPELKNLPTSFRKVTGIDGVHEQDAVIVPNIAFGGRSFSQVPASVAPLRFGRFDVKMDGIIGVALLKHFNVVMDFGRRLVWMRALPAPA